MCGTSSSTPGSWLQKTEQQKSLSAEKARGVQCQDCPESNTWGGRQSMNSQLFPLPNNIGMGREVKTDSQSCS